MRKLDLSNNTLHGGVPCSIRDMPNLEILYLLQKNFLALVPKQLGMVGKISTMDVSSNKLMGSIHLKFCKGGRLQDLIKENNLFYGPIPNSLGTCDSLVNIYMDQDTSNGSNQVGFLYLPMPQYIIL